MDVCCCVYHFTWPPLPPAFPASKPESSFVLNQVSFFSRPFLQMPLLTEGIRIHGEKQTEQLKPLHDRLSSCFRELKEKVEKLYGVITLVRLLSKRPIALFWSLSRFMI